MHECVVDYKFEMGRKKEGGVNENGPKRVRCRLCRLGIGAYIFTVFWYYWLMLYCIKPVMMKTGRLDDLQSCLHASTPLPFHPTPPLQWRVNRLNTHLPPSRCVPQPLERQWRPLSAAKAKTAAWGAWLRDAYRGINTPLEACASRASALFFYTIVLSLWLFLLFRSTILYN